MSNRGRAEAAFFEIVRRGDQKAVDEAIAADASLIQARTEAGLSPVPWRSISPRERRSCPTA